MSTMTVLMPKAAAAESVFADTAAAADADNGTAAAC